MKKRVMLWSSAAFMTLSSLTLPPGSVIYLTPLFAALSMLSLKGKKASEARETPELDLSQESFSSYVSFFIGEMK